MNPTDGTFFDRPILNSPYAYPRRHWELDADGQPTGRVIEARREARFVTPIPRPKKHKRAKAQSDFVFDEGAGVSTAGQQYDPTPIINELRRRVDQWRAIDSPIHWGVTPETRASSSTGVITSSAASGRSSVSSRRWRR